MKTHQKKSLRLEFMDFQGFFKGITIYKSDRVMPVYRRCMEEHRTKVHRLD